MCERYDKCCCCVELKRGVKILMMVLIVLNCISLLITIISSASGGSGSVAANIIGSIIAVGVSILVHGLVIVGINKDRRGYILPYLIIVMIGIVGLFLGGLIMIIASAVAGSQLRGSAYQALTVIGIVYGIVLIIIASVYTYFWKCVHSLYIMMGETGGAEAKQVV